MVIRRGGMVEQFRSHSLSWLSPYLMTKLEKAACCFCAVVFTVIGILFSASHHGSAIATYLLISIGMTVVVVASMRLYEVRTPSFSGVKGERHSFIMHVVIALFVAILFECGTLIGAYSSSPFRLSDWNVKRLAVYYGMAYTFILIARFRAHDSAAHNRVADRFCHTLCDYARRVRELSLKMKVVISALAIGSVVLASVEIMVFGHAPVVTAVFFIAVFLGLAALCVESSRPRLHVENIFLAIVLPAGMVIALAFPAGNLYSWDDEVHYTRALQLSYIADVEQTASDRMVGELFRVEPGFSADVSNDRYPIDLGQTWNQEEIDKTIAELDNNNRADTVSATYDINSFVASVTSVGYIPSAIGLWLGRLLRLPFTMTFLMGKIANLLFYSLVSYFAIRIIPVKKRLLLVLSLMPTTVFMAANYAYDPWVISLTHFALALFLREYLKTDDIDFGKVLASTGVFLIAFCPKAVYFPIMGIVCILLWTRCDKSDAKKCIIFALFMAFLLIVSFMLPIILPAPGDVGDLRGGTEVNSSGQLSFVMQSPLGYLSILIRFLLGNYLTVGTIEDGFTNLSYMGSLNSLYPFLTGFVLIAVIVVSILDSDSLSARMLSAKNRLWASFIIVCTLALVCSALYISFTAVGSSTIAGVQARYMAPLWLLVFCFVFSFRVEAHFSSRAFSCVVGIGTGLLLYGTLWLLVVSRIFA